jgi:hypothetical protein
MSDTFLTLKIIKEFLNVLHYDPLGDQMFEVFHNGSFYLYLFTEKMLQIFCFRLEISNDCEFSFHV